eukprot:989867_1
MTMPYIILITSKYHGGRGVSILTADMFEIKFRKNKSKTAGSLFTSYPQLSHVLIAANIRSGDDQQLQLIMIIITLCNSYDCSENMSKPSVIQINVVNLLTKQSIFVSLNDKQCSSNLEPSQCSLVKQRNFVRIVPQQTLLIPVSVEKDAAYSCYMTVHVTQENDELFCIAKHTPIDCAHVEVAKNASGQVVLVYKPQINSDADALLQSLQIPKHLRITMRHNGWNDIHLWNHINEKDLTLMGFKRGHRIKLLHYLMNRSGDFGYLFRQWCLPMHLYQNMKQNGWNDVHWWHLITDDDLKRMQFKAGHCVTFKQKICCNQHIMDDQMESVAPIVAPNNADKLGYVPLLSPPLNVAKPMAEIDVDELVSFDCSIKCITFASVLIEFDTDNMSYVSGANHSTFLLETKLEDATNSQSLWKEVCPLSSDTCQYLVNELKAKQAYDVRVRRFDIDSESSRLCMVKKFKTDQRLRFKFDQTAARYGFDLEFVSDLMVKRSCTDTWSTCALDEAITSHMAQQFVIEYKINSFGTYDGANFFIGFLTTADANQFNWNLQLGFGANKDKSIGIHIGKKHFVVYDEDNKTSLKYDGDEFECGDTFGFMFDFVASQCSLLYNTDHVIHVFELQTNIVIPAVSIVFQGQQIEISNCNIT